MIYREHCEFNFVFLIVLQKIYRLNDFLGEPAAVKERLVKHYRHPDLDNRLNKERMTFVHL